MNPYEDMLFLPHYRSDKHSHMTQLDRAAQFAPFAALSGYEGEIAEAGRLTDAQMELTEWAMEQVDEGLQQIRRELDRHPEVSLTWFVPDRRKAGGAYRTITARVRKILELERCLLLSDQTQIPFGQILSLAVR